MCSNCNEQTRHFVQIPLKRQSDFKEIKTDAPTQDKASQSLHLRVHLSQEKKKPSHLTFLLKCLYCAYSFWGQCTTPSLFLLLEKKLQRWVPLISWKAVGQLTVIQLLGNFAQTEKEQLHYTGCPTQILLKNGKNLNFIKTSPTCWEEFFTMNVFHVSILKYIKNMIGIDIVKNKLFFFFFRGQHLIFNH